MSGGVQSILRRKGDVRGKDFLRASWRLGERRGALNQREAFDVERCIATRFQQLLALHAAVVVQLRNRSALCQRRPRRFASSGNSFFNSSIPKTSV